MAQSDELLEKSQQFSREERWEDIFRTAEEWIRLSHALESWMNAMNIHTGYKF